MVGRSRGSCATHASISSCSDGRHQEGTEGRSSPEATCIMIANADDPFEVTSWYGILRVRSSQRTTPKLKTSAFSEYGWPLMISGAVQSGVPHWVSCMRGSAPAY